MRYALTAIEHFKMNKGDSDKSFKVPSISSTYCNRSTFARRLCREIISWKHLSHPNILPLFGVPVSADPCCFRILTEWMPGWNVIEYARSNSKGKPLEIGEPACYFASFH